MIVKLRRCPGRYGYVMNASWSIIVIAVSRCMNARTFGSSTAITRVTAPPLRSNQLRARISVPWAVVRSLIPTITAPLPMTRMSPPSHVAGSCGRSSFP